MRFKFRQITITLLVFLTLIFVSCAQSEANDSSSPTVTEAEAITVSITGRVAEIVFDESFTLFTDEQESIYDISSATIFGEIKSDDIVEVITNGKFALSVFIANEYSTIGKSVGYVVAVNDASIEVLIGSEVKTYDTSKADLLFSKHLGVGDYVGIIERQDGSAAEIEVLSYGGGIISGEVNMIADNFIAVSDASGGLYSFLTDGVIFFDDIDVGSSVSVGYHGTLNATNKTIFIKNTSATALPESGNIEGVVRDLCYDIIIVQTYSNETYAISYTPDNTFTGDRLSVGDSVKIDYITSDEGMLIADTITPTSYGDIFTAQLEGTVTRYDTGLISVRTENGNSYSFSHNEATAIHANAEPKVGDVVSVFFTQSENDLLHCETVVAADFEPSLEITTGDVLDISQGVITIFSDDAGEFSAYYLGATLNSPLPIMRGDNVTIEYLSVPSKDPTALSITFNSTDTPFVPQLSLLNQSGVVTGQVLHHDDDLLFVLGDNLRAYSFITDNTVFDEDPQFGDTVHVQYLGDITKSAEAAVVSIATSE